MPKKEEFGEIWVAIHHMEVFVLVAMLFFVLSVLCLDVEEKSKVYVEVALEKPAREGALGVPWKTASSAANGLTLRDSRRESLP